MAKQRKSKKKKRLSVWDEATPAQRRRWLSQDRADAGERAKKARLHYR